MNCRHFREQACQHVVELDLLAGDRARGIDPSEALEQWQARATDTSVPEHGQDCAPCAAYWRRLWIQVRLLGELTPKSAPADLEGRVVAALHPGHRQQRAVSFVESLPRLEAPPVLARKLEEAMSPKAPSALLERVEREFESSVAEVAGQRGERVMWSPLTAIVSASLLLLVIWTVGPDRQLDGPDSGSETDQQLAQGDSAKGPYRFEIIRVDSPRQASLDAATRVWIDGFSGGMLGSVD